MIKGLLLGMLMLLTAGCTPLFESHAPEQEAGPAVMTLTPVDLSVGKGAKFRPFLGVMSGAFKLRYEGNKPHARLDIDIWKDGKKAASSGSIGDLFYSSDGSGGREIEVIIAVDTVPVEGKEELRIVKVNTIDDTGSSLMTFTAKWDKRLTSRVLLQTAERITFKADEDVHVWGIQATSTGMIRTADLSEASLSGIEWGLIFTLRFQ
ncbi:hypothetical protein [Paenibacillus sp. R14(2021)]|uniref:hypothetical protein n=1 Tax=Paenibacillus sp. R14(2021) TaxID=2859228 RepID=UPI001C61617B|nr:hypothetical protein [Paenibacillus sp. R14(2021)]